MGHRYYNRATCRWLTRDPVGYSGGINLYAYCQNNPVNFADPLGLCREGGDRNRDYNWRGGNGPHVWDEAGDFDWRIVQECGFRTKLTCDLGGPLVGLGAGVTATVNLAAGPAAAVVGTGEDAAVTGAEQAIPLNPGYTGTGHALERHTINSLAEWASRSKFNTGEDVNALIQAAAHQPRVQAANGLYVASYDVGRVIGYDVRANADTSMITIISDVNGTVRTAYPGLP